MKRAQFQAEIQREQATAEQAGPLSEAKARQEVVAEEVRIERIRTQDRTFRSSAASGRTLQPNQLQNEMGIRCWDQ